MMRDRIYLLNTEWSIAHISTESVEFLAGFSPARCGAGKRGGMTVSRTTPTGYLLCAACVDSAHLNERKG